MYIGTEETRKLWDELRPWMIGARLREDAPEEIIELLEKYKQLCQEEEDRQIEMMDIKVGGL